MCTHLVKTSKLIKSEHALMLDNPVLWEKLFFCCSLFVCTWCILNVFSRSPFYIQRIVKWSKVELVELDTYFGFLFPPLSHKRNKREMDRNKVGIKWSYMLVFKAFVFVQLEKRLSFSTHPRNKSERAKNLHFWKDKKKSRKADFMR